MDFKTKRKIVIMRKFSHTDLAMIGGLLAMLSIIVFNVVNQGVLF